MPAPHAESAFSWGILPFALVVAIILAARLGPIALPRSGPRERVLAGAIGAIASVVVVVRVLGALGGLTPLAILGVSIVAAAAALFAKRSRRLGVAWRGLVTIETLPVAVVAAGVVLVALVAAYLLPIWQWDALGYHLPYINFALQDRAFAGVPHDMAYLSTYPHVVEDLYLAWRAMLPDDRLVDAAQISLGLVGAAAVAVLARQAGARRDHAVAAGLLWLTLPAVFLQLPTNYIDVAAAALLLAAAAFALAEPTPAHVVAAGVAIGLFLGSKPNAPIGAALLSLVVLGRGWKAGRRGALLIAGAAVLVLGAEAYVTNVVRHGNPIWPVRMSLGPITLPGLLPMKALLLSGCAAPRLEGPFVVRVLRSWINLDAAPVFDMRYGGLGLVFLMAIPAAIYGAVRQRSLALAAVVLASLASPDPAVPRYILAFPGIVLALASARLVHVRPWIRHTVLGLAAAFTVLGAVRAFPGLAGDGPPLTSYFSMTPRERLRAVGADGSPARFVDALARMKPGTTTAFDSSLELPYLAWPSDLATRAFHIQDGASEDEAARVVADPNVHLLIVGVGSPAAESAAKSGHFEQIFRCRTTAPPACAIDTPMPELPTADKDRFLDILNQRWPTCVVYARTAGQ